MGHLINPIGFRLGISDNIWADSWFFKRLYYSEFLLSVRTLREFIDFFFWDTNLRYKFIYSHSEILKSSNQINLNLYGYDSKLEDLIDKKMRAFFYFRKKQELNFSNVFGNLSKLNSSGFFYKELIDKQLGLNNLPGRVGEQLFSSYFSNKKFYLIWKIFLFSIFLKWRFRSKVNKWLRFPSKRKKLNNPKLAYFMDKKFNFNQNNINIFLYLYYWDSINIKKFKKDKNILKFLTNYKCKWFTKFFYFVSVLLNLTEEGSSDILKMQNLYSMRLKNFVKSNGRFKLFDFYLDPILYPLFRQTLLLQNESVLNYNLFSKFFSIISGFLLPLKVDVKVFSVDNSQVNSSFLANYISTKFSQGFFIWDVLNPIFQELNSFRRYNRLLGYRIIISGRLSRRSRSVKRTYFKGTLPLNTINSNIDYYFVSSSLRNGLIGIKIWLNRPSTWRGSYIKLN